MKRKPINVQHETWCDLQQAVVEHQRQGRNVKLHELTDRLLRRALASEKRRLAS